MAPGSRHVVWTLSALSDLNEAAAYIRLDSPAAACELVEKALQTATSLALYAGRGRIVPELQSQDLRELFVFKYRLMYRVLEERVEILAFVHGARDSGPGGLSRRGQI